MNRASSLKKRGEWEWGGESMRCSADRDLENAQRIRCASFLSADDSSFEVAAQRLKALCDMAFLRAVGEWIRPEILSIFSFR